MEQFGTRPPGVCRAMATERGSRFGSDRGRSAQEKKLATRIQIETKRLTVVGIVKGGALVEDGSVILSYTALTRNHRRSQPDQRNRYSSDAFDYRATNQGTYSTDRTTGPGSSRP